MAFMLLNLWSPQVNALSVPASGAQANAASERNVRL
jgi:hypothetical protein